MIFHRRGKGKGREDEEVNAHLKNNYCINYYKSTLNANVRIPFLASFCCRLSHRERNCLSYVVSSANETWRMISVVRAHGWYPHTHQAVWSTFLWNHRAVRFRLYWSRLSGRRWDGVASSRGFFPERERDHTDLIVLSYSSLETFKMPLYRAEQGSSLKLIVLKTKQESIRWIIVLILLEAPKVTSSTRIFQLEHARIFQGKDNAQLIRVSATILKSTNDKQRVLVVSKTVAWPFPPLVCPFK